MATQTSKPAVKKSTVTKTSSKAKTSKIVAKKAAPAAAKAKTTPTQAVKKAVAPVATTKPPVQKPAPAKAAKAPSSAKKTGGTITPEERYHMVATAAYFIAERHGFQGNSTEHWTTAEEEISRKLSQ
jgi:hypothetical protein